MMSERFVCPCTLLALCTHRTYISSQHIIMIMMVSLDCDGARRDRCLMYDVRLDGTLLDDASD